MKSKLYFAYLSLLLFACAPLPKESSLASGASGPVTGKNGTVFSFTGRASKVLVAGSFNGWSQDANPMRKSGGDRWEAIIKLPAGSHQYKFVADGAWMADPANPETADDGVGGVNSVVIVGAGAGSAAPAGKVSAAKAPEKVRGGVLFSYSNPSAGKVAVAGSFNNWSQDANVMRKNAAGIWSAVLPLGSGEHQYKFVVDGNWITDPSNSKIVTDPDGNENSVVSGGPAPSSSSSSQGKPGAALFEVEAPGANKVEVYGSWNGWSGGTGMKQSGAKWYTEMKLSPGIYEYKFMQDGDWDALNKDNRIIEVE